MERRGQGMREEKQSFDFSYHTLSFLVPFCPFSLNYPTHIIATGIRLLCMQETYDHFTTAACRVEKKSRLTATWMQET